MSEQKQQNVIEMWVGDESDVAAVLKARSTDENCPRLHNVFVTKAFGQDYIVATNGHVLAGAPFQMREEWEVEVKGDAIEGVYSVKEYPAEDDPWGYERKRLDLILCEDPFPTERIKKAITYISDNILKTPPTFFVREVLAEYQLKAFLYGKREIVNPAEINFLPEFMENSGAKYNVWELPEGFPLNGESSLFWNKYDIFVIAAGLRDSRRQLSEIYSEFLSNPSGKATK